MMLITEKRTNLKSVLRYYSKHALVQIEFIKVPTIHFIAL